MGLFFFYSVLSHVCTPLTIFTRVSVTVEPNDQALTSDQDAVKETIREFPKLLSLECKWKGKQHKTSLTDSHSFEDVLHRVTKLRVFSEFLTTNPLFFSFLLQSVIL